MMSFRVTFAALAIAGALAVSGQTVQAGEAGPGAANLKLQSYPGESYSQYYGRRYGYGRGYGRRGYGGGAAAAGIAGLAAGALVAGAIASQPGYAAQPGAPVGNVYGHDPNWVSYCASRYRSFDPASGTFLANDGNRYVCQ